MISPVNARSDNPFWDFSLAVYAADGVAPACLRLQDRHGLDINLLLYCCWAGQRGIALDASAMTRILELTAGWTANIVQPLRSVRRALKGGFEKMPEAACAALRSAVVKLELESERIEQDALLAVLPASAPPQNGQSEVARTNVETYLAAQGAVADRAALADIERLIDASGAWRA